VKNEFGCSSGRIETSSEDKMNRCQSGSWPVQLKTLIQDFQREMTNLEAKFINLDYWLILTIIMFELSLTTMLSCN